MRPITELEREDDQSSFEDAEKYAAVDWSREVVATKYKPVRERSLDFCSRQGCHKVADPYYLQWITLQGRSEKLSFCSRHGREEYEAECLYRAGL